MTKDDLLECVELCEELDEINLKIAELELRAEDYAGLARIVAERRLATLRKRALNISEEVAVWVSKINRLPSVEFRLIYMRYFEKKHWQLVANELGFSVDHVKGKLCKKALKDLEKF